VQNKRNGTGSSGRLKLAPLASTLFFGAAYYNSPV
jgi:hypothetical protein